MIDEKDPGRESINDEDSDDDVIIDLTEEVIIKPEDENRVLTLTDDMADDSPGDPETEKSSDTEPDEEILPLDDVIAMPPAPEETVETHQFETEESEDSGNEDQIITTAIDESLETDPDNDREPGDLFDFETSADDNFPVIDDAPEEEVDVSTPAEALPSKKSRHGEEAFELEEEIELEYESDDEEEKVLDLERSDDDQDFVSMVLERSKTSDPADDDYEPTQYLELESEELDDIVLPEEDREDEADELVTPEKREELTPGDELPDIEAISDLDFDDINNSEDNLEFEVGETVSSDDILAGVGRTAGPVDTGETEAADEHAVLGLDEIENFPGLIDSDEVDQEILPLTDDEPLVFEDESASLDLEEGLDPEIDDEVIPLDGFPDTIDDQEEEIIEITEFDQHYPVEGETLLKQTGILDPSRTEEDDFLELIDVEEDILSEDQEVVEFGDPPMADTGEPVDRLTEPESEEAESQSTIPESVFNDDVEDQMLEEEVSDGDPEVSLEDDDHEDEDALALHEENMEAEAGLPEEDKTEVSSPAEAIFPETANFDFNIDPGSIAKQVDQLDTFWAEDPSTIHSQTSFPSDYPVSDNTEETAVDKVLAGDDDDASAAIPESTEDTAIFGDDSSSEEIPSEETGARVDPDELVSVPAGQIDAAIERVITEKFAGKIEGIIYEVIEKAVTKEISRLKGALTGENETE